MSKLKMLKLPKKPKRSASLETKEKYLAKVKAIEEENKKREKVNKESERLSQVIAGIGAIKTFSSGFSARNIRAKRSHARKKAAVVKIKRGHHVGAKHKTHRRKRR